MYSCGTGNAYDDHDDFNEDASIKYKGKAKANKGGGNSMDKSCAHKSKITNCDRYGYIAG